MDNIGPGGDWDILHQQTKHWPGSLKQVTVLLRLCEQLAVRELLQVETM